MKKKIHPIIFVVCILMLSLSFSSLVWGTWGDTAADKLVAEFGWRGIFIGVFYNVLLPPLLKFHEHLPSIIRENPKVEDPIIYSPLSTFIKILEPFYIVLIISCGFYIILLSISPKERANAKSLLPRLLMSMILVTLSPYMLRFLFSASEELSSDILSFNPQSANIFRETTILLTNEFATKTAISFEAGHFIFLIEMLLILLVFLMVAFRYVVLTIFTVLTPLAIFFYFLNTTKSIGRKILEQTFLWSFLQAVFAFIFVVSNISVETLALRGNLLILTGFIASLIFIFAPIAIFFAIRRFLP